VRILVVGSRHDTFVRHLSSIKGLRRFCRASRTLMPKLRVSKFGATDVFECVEPCDFR